jgi:hypothetical protein
MKWHITELINDTGEKVKAHAPVIVSASRSTDIPTFYSDWFIERWKRGHVCWINPFNNSPVYVSFKKTRLVVFWTKNPKPMMRHLDFLDAQVRNYYFHYSLNDYNKENLEGKVPNINSRIETFIQLSERIGKSKVIWRFDPIILTDKIGVEEILQKAEYVGSRLQGYTEKLVISFADISIYPKVVSNLRRGKVAFKEFTVSLMEEVAEGICRLNDGWKFEIATCSEKIDLYKFGISHNKCIDDDLITRVFNHDKPLMDFLGVETSEPTLFDDIIAIRKAGKLKDKGQREACGCIMSKDIGQYNTCPHECVYCYANSSKEAAFNNYKRHIMDPFYETITGR